MNRRLEEHFLNLIDPFYLDATLDNCPDLPRALIDFGKRWVLNPSSLYIVGSYGAAKTWFCYGLARGVIRERGLWPFFLSSDTLDNRLKDALFEGSESHEIQKLIEADVLFVDDVGRETKSDRIKRRYYTIVDKRMAKEKPTVFTSNFLLEELHEVIDPSVISRMQLWELLHFPNRDLRKQVC